MEALETVRNLEIQLVAKRKEVSIALRASREKLGLSLREVGHKVKLTPGALLNIEQGKSWKTRTVQKIARFYDRAA